MNADLVLEGGGVKGIALVGAITELEAAGFRFRRVAGSSAGAIVGALVAAGVPGGQLADIMRSVDYRKFRDEDWLQRVTGPVGTVMSLLTHGGVFEGDYLVSFLERQLGEAGVCRFADLPQLADSENVLPDDRRSRLVVLASDITARRLVYLPWDYQRAYGLDPGEQRIAHAVRASMAIPFFFEPFHLNHVVRHDDGSLHEIDTVLVDGGMLSNFPVDVFDRQDGRSPRWPTFGLKLSARIEDKQRALPPVIHGPVQQALALLGTMTGFYDAMHIDREEVKARTIFIDTLGIRTTEFDIAAEDQQRLYESGQQAVRKFLATWDFDAYVRRFRSADAADAVRTGSAVPAPVMKP